MIPYAFGTSLLNRLLPIAIVVFRYVYACKSNWVFTARQRTIFHFLICSSTIIIAGGLTLFSHIYREKSLHYLDCIGERSKFYDEVEKDSNLAWALPFYHPFHLSCILAFFSNSFVVPLGYATIYHFRKKQDKKMTGNLDERTLTTRKNKNIVSTRFSFLNWIVEASGFLVLIRKEEFVYTAYFAVISCVVPIIYYIGIGVNRRAIKNRILTNFRGKTSGYYMGAIKHDCS